MVCATVAHYGIIAREELMKTTASTTTSDGATPTTLESLTA
jgi:hypothetical protein